MKFLCIQCDEQMKLLETQPPEPGAGVSIRFGCPSCSFQVGMLTNPSETQLVTSLGVRIGPASEGEDGLAKCPFGDMVRQMGLSDSSQSGISWTKEAISRLQNIPDFVRPMARQGVEQFARDRGYREIDERVLDEARERFGM